MDWSKFDRANWIAIGGAATSGLIALASLWNAVMARRIARNSFQLAVEARDRTIPSLELYIDHSYIRRIAEPARKVFVFRVVVANRSDAPNSMKRARLMIEHQHGDGPSSRLDVPHDPSCAAALGFADDDVLKLPDAIAQRAVVAGMLLFPVAQALLTDTRVEAYEVSLTDTFEKESRREVLLLTEQPVGKRQMA